MFDLRPEVARRPSAPSVDRGASYKRVLMKRHTSISSLVCLVLGLALAACGSDNNTADTGSSVDAPAATTLYARLGGRAGIASAVDAIVVDEVADAEIAAFFANAGMAGRPTVDQIKACLVNQLANAAGGPEAYPGVPADSLGWQCRSMTAAHAGLGISGAVFDRFVTIAAGTLTRLGVASADIAVIGSVLNGTRADIVAP